MSLTLCNCVECGRECIGLAYVRSKKNIPKKYSEHPRMRGTINGRQICEECIGTHGLKAPNTGLTLRQRLSLSKTSGG